MKRETWTWTTPRLAAPARLTRWGHFGIPVLIFPTAGGDLEEIEHFGLIAALAPLIEAGRMKACRISCRATRLRELSCLMISLPRNRCGAVLNQPRRSPRPISASNG